MQQTGDKEEVRMPPVAWDTKDTKCSDEGKGSVHLYRAPAPITLGKQLLLRQAADTTGRVARKSGFVSAGEEQQQSGQTQESWLSTAR